MNCCNHCQDAEYFFSDRTAKRDLRRYKRKGPDKSTRLLLDGIRYGGIEGESLLDIGGGVGIIPLELFKSGLARAVNVDASRPYQIVSHKESERRGFTGKSSYHYGDYTEIARSLEKSDIVTLDKVICCYPDLEKLIRTSVQKADKMYGVIYPRENILTQFAIWFGNLWFRFKGINFRTYLHSPLEIDLRIRENGFQKLKSATTVFWHIAVYERPGVE